MSKVDAIVKENPDVSLDDLVNTRKINTDQKTQILKKPALQSSLVQLEEQISAYRKVEEEFKDRLQLEKDRLEAAHQEKLQHAKDELRQELETDAAQASRQRLLTLSKFLRAAAARRQSDDEDSEDSRGFEGVLLLLYGGDTPAVGAAEKLINGTADKINSTDGNALNVTCKSCRHFKTLSPPVTFSDLLHFTDERIKELSLEYAPFAAEEAWVDGVAQAELETTNESDNTIANVAGIETTTANLNLNENTDAIVTTANGVTEGQPVPVPAQSAVDAEAANATAAAKWDDTAPDESVEPVAESWVSIPRHPHETETPSTVPAPTATSNWAEDATAEAARSQQTSGAAAAPPNDGFSEVHHGRGGRGRGNYSQDFRGRGRGGFRADGPRGRGGYRGDRGNDGGYRGRGRGGRSGRSRDMT